MVSFLFLSRMTYFARIINKIQLKNAMMSATAIKVAKLQTIIIVCLRVLEREALKVSIFEMSGFWRTKLSKYLRMVSLIPFGQVNLIPNIASVIYGETTAPMMTKTKNKPIRSADLFTPRLNPNKNPSANIKTNIMLTTSETMLAIDIYASLFEIIS